MMNTNSLSLRDIHLGISALDKIVVGDDENLCQNPEKARNIPTLAANPVPAVCGDTTCTGSGGMCPFAQGPIVVPYVVAIRWGALLTCSLDSRSATELGNIVFDVPPAKFTL